MSIITYKKFFIGFSIVLVLISLGLMNTYGIKKGIDFTGGSVIDITYTETPKELTDSMFEGKDILVYSTGEATYRFVSAKTYEELK